MFSGLFCMNLFCVFSANFLYISRSDGADLEFEALQSLVVNRENPQGQVPTEQKTNSYSSTIVSNYQPRLSTVSANATETSQTTLFQSTSFNQGAHDGQSNENSNNEPYTAPAARAAAASAGATPAPAKFCHECGMLYPTPSAKFCPECGERRVFK